MATTKGIQICALAQGTGSPRLTAHETSRHHVVIDPEDQISHLEVLVEYPPHRLQSAILSEDFMAAGDGSYSESFEIDCTHLSAEYSVEEGYATLVLISRDNVHRFVVYFDDDEDRTTPTRVWYSANGSVQRRCTIKKYEDLRDLYVQHILDCTYESIQMRERIAMAQGSESKGRPAQSRSVQSFRTGELLKWQKSSAFATLSPGLRRQIADELDKRSRRWALKEGQKEMWPNFSPEFVGNVLSQIKGYMAFRGVNDTLSQPEKRRLVANFLKRQVKDFMHPWDVKTVVTIIDIHAEDFRQMTYAYRASKIDKKLKRHEKAVRTWQKFSYHKKPRAQCARYEVPEHIKEAQRFWNEYANLGGYIEIVKAVRSANYKRQGDLPVMAVAQGEDGASANDLEQTSDVSGNANITFVDERPVDSAALYVGDNKSTSDTHGDMADIPWNIQDILTREQRVGEFTWASQDAGTYLYDEGAPYSIVKCVQCMITTMLKTFAFGRYGIEYRVQFNGTKFHLGRLLVYFQPLMFKEDQRNYHWMTCTAWPHFFLDASVSNSGTLFIPFTHLLTHFPHRANSIEPDICTLGALRIVVYNKLGFGDGASTSLRGTVYARLVNPEVHQPTYPIESFSFRSDGLAQGLEGVLKSAAGGAISAGLGLADKFTGGLVTGVGDALSNIFGMNCDKPTDPVAPAPVVNRMADPLCHGAGLDHSIRLALSPVSATEPDPSIMAGTSTDYDIRTLLQIPTCLEIVDWTTADLPGKELTFEMVSPTFVTRPAVQQQRVLYRQTMLSYVSRQFCYYRGDIEYEIQVIATGFHSGRLAFVHDPTYTNDFKSSLTLDHQQNHNMVIMDIEEKQSLTVTASYMSVRPWLRCDRFRDTNNWNNSTAALAVPNSRLGQDNFGRFSIYVLNALVAPSNVAQTVNINVFVKAGKNFELAVPTSLYPLSHDIDDVFYGATTDYPYQLKASCATCADNRPLIMQKYYEYQLLQADGKITTATGKNWWEAEPLPGIASTGEVMVWLADVNKLTRYMEGTPDQNTDLMKSLAVCPNRSTCGVAVAQGLETYTTTRENTGASVMMTKGDTTTEIAPITVSENGMNLQTLLRRFWPYYTSKCINSRVGYVLVTIPVNPHYIPQADQPIKGALDTFKTMNGLKWMGKLFHYWSGSIRFKAIFSGCSNTDVHCWHIPMETHGFSIREGYHETEILKYMNFAGALAVTKLQNSLEVEVPFFSPYNQLLQDSQGKHFNLLAQNGTLFVAFRAGVEARPLNFTIYISTGDDFIFNVLRPPPYVFEETRTYNYDETRVQAPEVAMSTSDYSLYSQVPGTSGLPATEGGGAMTFVTGPPAAPEMPRAQGLLGRAVEEELSQTCQDFRSVASEARETLGMLQTPLHHLTQNSSLFLEQMAKMTEVVEHTSRQASGLVGKIDELLPGVAAHAHHTMSATQQTLDTTHNQLLTIPSMLQGAGIILSLANVMREPDNFGWWVGLVTSCCLYFEVNVNMILTSVNDARHWLGSLFLVEQKEAPRAQANDGALGFLADNQGLITKIIGVMASAVYAFVFGKLPSLTNFKKMLKDFFSKEEQVPEAQGLTDVLRNVHFSRLGFESLVKIYEYISQAVGKLIIWFCDLENPEVAAARTQEQYRHKVMKFLREIRELDNERTMLEALKDPLVHNRFYNLVQDSEDLMDLVISNKIIGNGVQQTIMRAHAKVAGIIKRLEQEVVVENFRYDPFVVCLHGETGTGKTKMMDQVAKILLEVNEAPAYNATYSKGIADEFWSGYSGQTIVLWDEFGQNVKADDKSVPEFMELRGNIPKRLNMAALEEKGRAFVSRGVVMATNVPFQKFNTVRDNDALFRRRHCMIGMQHKAGFDANVMQNTEGFDPSFTHVTFALTDNMTNEVKVPNLSFEEICTHIRGHATRWHQKQMALYAAWKESGDSNVLPPGIVVVETPEPPQPEIMWTGEQVRYHRIQEEAEMAEFVDAVEEFEPDNPFAEDYVAVPQVMVTPPTPPPHRVLREPVNPFDEDDYDEDLNPFAEEPEAIAQALDGVVFYTVERSNPFAEDDELLDMQFDEIKEGLLKTHGQERLREFFEQQQRKLEMKAYKIDNILNSHFDKCKKKASDFFERHPKITQACQMLGTLAVVAVSIKTLMLMFGGLSAGASWLFGKKAEEEKQEELEEVKSIPMADSEAGKYDAGPKKTPHRTIRSQGTSDPNAYEIAAHRIFPYLGVFGWCDDAVKATILRGMWIGGKVLLLPYHFFRGARNGDYFWYVRNGERVSIEYIHDRLFQYEHKDWCLYACPGNVPSRKLGINLFVSEEHLDRVQLTSAMLCGVTPLGVYQEKTVQARSCREFRYKLANEETFTQTGFDYLTHTKEGECGSPLVAFSTQLPPPGKVLGIHVAGLTKDPHGYAVLITKEKLQRLYEIVASEYPQVVGMPVIAEVQGDDLDACRIIPKGNYSLYGSVPQQLCPAQPQKSSLRPTPFQGQIPVTSKPAHLKPFVDPEGNRISPLAKALTKYGTVTRPFPQSEVNIVKVHMAERLREKLKPTLNRRKLTVQEAVNGIEGVEYADRLNMQSSPGLPYQLEKEARKGGKAWLFNEDGTIKNPALSRHLQHREEEARQGRRVISTWRDCLKDELRPVEKVDAGKTRLFTIAPVDYTILVRQYFMDFVIAFYSSKCTFFSAVGIDPESYEWTQLYNYLRQCGTQAVAGDFSTFDGSLKPELMEACAEIVNEWYDDDEESKSVRRVLVDEMIHTVQQVENCLYATHQGNPSGNPLTVVINCMVNAMYMMLAWRAVFRGDEARPLQVFEESTRLITYGDDNIITVKDPYSAFNQNSITRFLADYGITYTLENKSTGEVPDFRPLNEVTFLKRGFGKMEEFGSDIWCPLMDKTTLARLFNWYRENQDPEEQLRDNMKAALWFAFFHGREYFDEYNGKYKAAMRQQNYEPVLWQYQELVERFAAKCGQATDQSELLAVSALPFAS